MIDYIRYRLGSSVEDLQDLQKYNSDWDIIKIQSKTGINKRYLSTSEETALSLAVEAGKALLGDVKAKIDGLVYVSQTPDSLIPGTAFLLHDALKLPSACFVYDINHGCAGFVYALALAVSQIQILGLKNCLVVCSEVYTKHIMKNDRTCRPIFSDGACAVLITDADVSRIGPFIFYTDSSGASDLTLRQTAQGTALFMDGAKVLLFTMSQVPKAIHDLLGRAGLVIDEIDMFVFHQASKVVLDNIQRILNISDEKLYRQSPSIGNTVSATIGIALKEGYESGKIRQGMTVVLMGFGVGLSLAGCIYKV